jgi:hypothetical protein
MSPQAYIDVLNVQWSCADLLVCTEESDQGKTLGSATETALPRSGDPNSFHTTIQPGTTEP